MTSKDQKAGSTASLQQKFHNDDPEAAVQSALLEHPSYIELQNKLTEAEEKATQNWDRMLRIQAEMDNMSRRVERDVSNAHKYALEKFTLDLLPCIDSLERATAVPADQGSEAMLEGIRLTLKMLYGVLEKFNIQQVDPISQPFNPELHQAVSTVEDSSVAPGTVTQVLQKGYLLNNRLIRPALVIVSKS